MQQELASRMDEKEWVIEQLLIRILYNIYTNKTTKEKRKRKKKDNGTCFN